jgi:hypothetical protein
MRQKVHLPVPRKISNLEHTTPWVMGKAAWKSIFKRQSLGPGEEKPCFSLTSPLKILRETLISGPWHPGRHSSPLPADSP